MELEIWQSKLPYKAYRICTFSFAICNLCWICEWVWTGGSQKWARMVDYSVSTNKISIKTREITIYYTYIKESTLRPIYLVFLTTLGTVSSLWRRKNNAFRFDWHDTHFDRLPNGKPIFLTHNTQCTHTQCNSHLAQNDNRDVGKRAKRLPFEKKNKFSIVLCDFVYLLFVCCSYLRRCFISSFFFSGK